MTTQDIPKQVGIVGAGPAGLTAVLKAARTGSRVFLVDENTEIGGSLLNRKLTIHDKPSEQWLAETLAELAALPT